MQRILVIGAGAHGLPVRRAHGGKRRAGHADRRGRGADRRHKARRDHAQPTTTAPVPSRWRRATHHNQSELSILSFCLQKEYTAPPRSDQSPISPPPGLSSSHSRTASETPKSLYKSFQVRASSRASPLSPPTSTAQLTSSSHGAGHLEIGAMTPEGAQGALDAVTLLTRAGFDARSNRRSTSLSGRRWPSTPP